MFTEKLCSLMKELVFQADVVTPNLTELCLLTDTDFRMIRELTDEKHLLVVVEQMAARGQACLKRYEDGRAGFNCQGECESRFFG